MKKIIITFSVLLISSYMLAQNQIKVYENNDTVCFFSPHSLHNDVVLFNTQRLLWNEVADSNNLINVDTVFYEVNAFNTKTYEKKRYLVKSSLDTLYFAWTHTPYFNSYDNRYYFTGAKISLKNFDYTRSDTLLKDFYVESYDTNLTTRKIVFLQNPVQYSSFQACNKLFYKDSVIYAMSFDSNNHPIFCKNSLIDGHLMDTATVKQKFVNSGFIRMDWLNDSVIVLFSDYINYINVRQMKLIDTVLVTISNVNSIVKPLDCKFIINDSSYIFQGQHDNSSPFSKYYINSSGVISKNIHNNTVTDSAQYQAPNYINYTYQLWDYININHFYSTFSSIDANATFAITHTNSNGITDWVKIMELDSELCRYVTPCALNDNSVLVLIETVPNLSNHRYNIYYLKLDEFGNNITNPLAITTPIKSKNELTIYPNPVSNQLYIGNINLSEVKTIEIYNSIGQIVIKSEDKLIIPTENLLNGNYFVKIETKNGVSIKQFIKK